MAKKNIKVLDKSFFRKLSLRVRDMYKAHTFDPKGGGKNAKDVKNRKFDGYSNPDDPNSYGNRKKGGLLKADDGTPQSNKFKNSTAPVLTGRLMNSFDVVKSFDTGFGFGLTVYGGVVKRLSALGRILYSIHDPLPRHIKKYIDNRVDDEVKQTFNKIDRVIKNKIINIKT